MNPIIFIPVIKIHATSILLSTPTSCKWPLYCRFPYQYPRVFLLFPIRATCLPHHLSYIWRTEHTLNLRIKHCPASLLSLLCPAAVSSSAASSRTFSLFSSLQAKDQVSPLHKIMFVCCTNTDPNNRHPSREPPLNKRTRYDNDQAKLEFRHFPDYLSHFFASGKR